MEERLLITGNALRRISRILGMPAGMAEKDYVISWPLREIYEDTPLKDSLIFKGGTALRKVYFPETWKLSHDLDFTVLGGLNPDEINSGLREAFQALDLKCSLAFSFDSFHVTEGSIITRIQYMGPLLYKNQIKADVTLDEKLIFDPEWKVIKTVYPDLPDFRVKVYSLREILIEKIRSIIQRGKSRDYYDVWRLLTENDFDMEDTRKLLIRKCEINNIEYNPDLIFDDERLESAKKYWDKYLTNLTKELPEFDHMILELKKQLVFWCCAVTGQNSAADIR